MANVELPQIGINNTQIDEAGMDGLKQHVKSLLNVTVMLTEELSYLLNNLDTRNVNELNADIINAGTINANLVKIMSELSNGGYISFDGEGMKVNDGTRDTMTIGLDGKPKMTGAEIQSAEGYPKVVMDPEGNLFGAYSSESSYATLQALMNVNSSPQFQLWAGQSNIFMYTRTNGAYLGATNVPLRIGASNGVYFDVGTFGTVHIPSFSNFVAENTSRSLSDVLNDKATRGISTGTSGSANGGIPIGTVLRTADGGAVTWTGIPSHTHAQN